MQKQELAGIYSMDHDIDTFAERIFDVNGNALDHYTIELVGKNGKNGKLIDTKIFDLMEEIVGEDDFKRLCDSLRKIKN